MSGRFDELIRFIPTIEDKDFGKWIVDRDNDGTTEKPLQIPFVNYSQ